MNVRWLVIAAAVIALGVGGALAQGTDVDLAAGIRHVDEGDFEAALVPLGRAVRTLSGDSSRSKELAQAHLYLGIAYVLLDQEKAGKASFREALKLQGDLRISADRVPAKVVRVFEAAAQAAATEADPDGPAIPASSAAGATATEIAFWNSVASSRNPKDFEEYLRQYPRGRFAGLARNRAEELGGARSRRAKAEARPPSDDAPPEIGEAEDLLKRATADFQSIQPSRCIVILDEVAAKLEPVRSRGTLTSRGLEILQEAYVLQGRTYGNIGLDLKAEEAYGKACAAGGQSGCEALMTAAVLHRAGTKTAKKSDARSAELAGQACQAGHAAGCLWLGGMHESGKGVAKDKIRALELYRRACEGGEPQACANAQRLEARQPDRR